MNDIDVIIETQESAKASYAKSLNRRVTTAFSGSDIGGTKEAEVCSSDIEEQKRSV